jgi:hypothetical protein
MDNSLSQSDRAGVLGPPGDPACVSDRRVSHEEEQKQRNPLVRSHHCKDHSQLDSHRSLSRRPGFRARVRSGNLTKLSLTLYCISLKFDL